MPIRFPGAEIREPLRPRPLAGAVIGALAGTVFAILADAGTFHVPRRAQTLGFVVGGACAGALVGGLALLFRKRLTAALAVWIAGSIGLYVANRHWHEFPDPAGSLLLGLIGAGSLSGCSSSCTGDPRTDNYFCAQRNMGAYQNQVNQKTISHGTSAG